jgi:uncharacterized protein YjgD (DUF1641 family)
MTPATETGADAQSRSELSDLSELASIVSAARDALSDDMVTRLSSAFSEGITLLDRLTRNQGLMRLLQVLDRPESQKWLMSLADALNSMSREIAVTEPARGGMSGMLRLALDPGTQEGLRALSLLGKYWSTNLRDLNARRD